MKAIIFFTIITLTLYACQPNEPSNQDNKVQKKSNIQAISLLGDTLTSPAPSEKVLAQYEEKKTIYEADLNDIENLIWFGRFTAYKGDYQKAIDIYTNGIELFPTDARLFRHRGHRYITVREYDKAIKDLEYASKLVAGQSNETEPDGMPNAQNIPISTLHGNIYYHLGLAFYLKNDLNNALTAYEKCLISGDNEDNLVSSTHWIYMILRRMEENGAETPLEPIQKDLEVIENDSYHKLCLFYKGLITEEELRVGEESFSANDAISYGLGNWYLYNGDTAQAKYIFNEMLESNGWNSFGYIAAEADLAR